MQVILVEIFTIVELALFSGHEWLTWDGENLSGLFMVWSFLPVSWLIVWGSLHGCQELLGLVIVNKVIRNDFQANVWRGGLSEWK